MSTTRNARKQGIAIAMVLFFVFIFLTFATAMFFTRSGRKRQTRLSMMYLRSHFLAQGALQHALLKIRMLPNEVFDASCIQRGICPFKRYDTVSAIPTGTGDDTLMFAIREELTTKAGAQKFPVAIALSPSIAGLDFSGWEYEVAEMQAVASKQESASMKHVIEITARAFVPDPKPGEPERVEVVKKTVEIERSR